MKQRPTIPRAEHYYMTADLQTQCAQLMTDILHLQPEQRIDPDDPSVAFCYYSDVYEPVAHELGSKDEAPAVRVRQSATVSQTSKESVVSGTVSYDVNETPSDYSAYVIDLGTLKDNHDDNDRDEHDNFHWQPWITAILERERSVIEGDDIYTTSVLHIDNGDELTDAELTETIELLSAIIRTSQEHILYQSSKLLTPPTPRERISTLALREFTPDDSAASQCDECKRSSRFCVHKPSDSSRLR